MTTTGAPFYFETYDAANHVIMSAEPPVTETDTGLNPKTPNPVRERVDGVIDDLTKRITPEPDRTRLRKALDTADAPETGRAASDKALGRVAARG
jgi:hypothetical protein